MERRQTFSADMDEWEICALSIKFVIVIFVYCIFGGDRGIEADLA